MCPIYSNISRHNYADDTQIYFALSTSDYSPMDSLCNGTEQLKGWMRLNFLKLHADEKLR